MTANIKLTRFAASDLSLPRPFQQAWPVEILAEGVLMDDHIFVYHVGKTGDPIPGDKFECVASVNQMYELPKKQGISLTTETGIPYYRSNVLQYVCRSATEAARIWTEVVSEVQLLVANWNSALTLQATDFATIDGSSAIISGFTMTPPYRIQISSHPCGAASIVSGQQVITAPDGSMPGWLPVSAISPTIVVPPGAAFFYNLAQDSTLQAIWPPAQPYSGNQLYRNGLLLPYGVVWVLTQDTLWWLNFNPSTIPGYQRQTPQPNDGNGPWALDWVSPDSPGIVQPMLILNLFK